MWSQCKRFHFNWSVTRVCGKVVVGMVSILATPPAPLTRIHVLTLFMHRNCPERVAVFLFVLSCLLRSNTFESSWPQKTASTQRTSGLVSSENKKKFASGRRYPSTEKFFNFNRCFGADFSLALLREAPKCFIYTRWSRMCVGERTLMRKSRKIDAPTFADPWTLRRKNWFSGARVLKDFPARSFKLWKRVHLSVFPLNRSAWWGCDQ